jgi:FecR protein
MQKLHTLLLGTLAVLPLCSFGAVNVDFSSGNFTSDGQHLATGKNGHAEAVLDAQGSVIRFGSNTQADVGNERDVTLSKGLLLVSSGEGFLRRSGVVIHTPEGNITVRGTVLVAVLPDGAVKLTCLEGGVRGDLGGQGFSLHPGELIIQRGDSTRDIVQVNLHSLAGSCALLVGDGFKPLHFAANIDQAVAQQDKAIAAEHHHSAGQHVAGSSQGEPSNFLARLFSGHSNDSNTPSGSVGGATFSISQGSTFSGTSAISSAGSSLTLSGVNANALMGNSSYAGSVVMTNTVSANPPEAALTASSNPVRTGAGTLILGANNNATFPGSTNLVANTYAGGSVSGSSVSFSGVNANSSSGLPYIISGATITLNSGSSNTLYTGGVNASGVGTAGGVIATLGAVIASGVGTATNFNVNSSGATNINLTNVNTADFISGGTTLIYNGHEYHGQDAVNMINSLQHPTTPSTP